MPVNFDFAIVSDAGPRRENEDSVGVWRLQDGGIIAAVADGLGGMGAGKLASSTALLEIEKRINEGLAISTWFEAIGLAAHNAILAGQSRSIDASTMATTLTAVWLTPTGQMVCVHCGDSRLAVARGRGIKRITVDHSEGMRLLAAGKISKDEYADYPRKHILDSALGMTKVPRIDVLNWQLEAGDKLLLSTDGVHQKVFLSEARIALEQSVTPESALDLLVLEVRHKEADDNFSAAVIFCHEPG
jgi:serine/threonine protein phosphatase PrpC